MTALLPVLEGLLERRRPLRELTALAVIALQPGCSLRDVTRHLKCPKGTAAWVIDKLQTDGLVVREVGDEDARLIRLLPTTAGAQEYAALHRLTVALG